jgi:hypothetical protein
MRFALMRLATALLLAAVACLAACAPAATVRPTDAELARPSRTSVEVPLTNLSSTQAVQRITSAFAAEGLAVASADTGVVVSRPVRVRSTMSVEIEMRYVATVIREERGPRVIVTGESRLFGRSERWSPVGSHDRSWPSGEDYHGFLKVRRIAARLAGEAPPESE